MARFITWQVSFVTHLCIMSALVTISNAARASETPVLYLPTFYFSRPGVDNAIVGHVSQVDIQQGLWTLSQLKLAGERLFVASFTSLDGAGRPGATGNPSPTRRPLGSGPDFARTAGPDANSCLSCHNMPSIGGAGDFAVNVFAGLGARQPVLHSTDAKFSGERGTPALQGSAAVELLAREMTLELFAVRSNAIERARVSTEAVRLPLVAKGVSFGYVSAEPDGTVRLHEVQGVDRDLVVRPWGQKGTVTSLRTFTINAANLHHGMQATERFGFDQTGSSDFDRDGISDELSVGDVTALVIFQASLGVPGQVLPFNPALRQKVERGRNLFHKSKCADCHIPELVLKDPIFREPGPFNLEGTLRMNEVRKVLELDLTRDTEQPRLERQGDGSAVVRAYTDFKRHRISDADRPHFGNETLVEGFVPTDQYITKRLWDVGNTPPYGHRGDLTTIREAILHHGGEATEARREFEDLPWEDQQAIVRFLESLQILPPGSPPVIIESAPVVLPYVRRPEFVER